MLFTLKVDNFSREEAINYTRRSDQGRTNAFTLKVGNFTREEMHGTLKRGALLERRQTAPNPQVDPRVWNRMLWCPMQDSNL